MYPHFIRLREPWWQGHYDDAGIYFYQRGFHRPTTSGGERVWLVCEGPKYDAVVFLDNRKLGTVKAGDDLWSWDVTERLIQRHEVRFELLDWPEDELPWREVRLEIRLHSTPEERPA